jgi:hypothetical protein
VIKKSLKLLLLAAVFSFIIPASGSIQWEPPAREFGRYRENASLPVSSYSHLMIIYTSTDAQYVKDGVVNRYTGTMDESLKETIISEFNNMNFLGTDGSANREYALLDHMVITTPITKISHFSGNMYWLSPDDVKADLAKYAPPGKFDAVHVVWHNGTIDAYFGLGGIFINNGKTTFDSVIAGKDYFWKGGTYRGQVFLHEWLHAVTWYYSQHGYVMPDGGPDGGGSHGYKEDPDMGWMLFYRDLMQGKVWEPKTARYTGITAAAWGLGPPNQTKLKVTIPNGGEEWVEGETRGITWVQLKQVGSVSIELLKNGVVYRDFGDFPVNARLFNWTPPLGLADGSTDARFQVRIANSSSSDLSDKKFSILKMIYAPSNAQGKKYLNRSLSQAEYINELKWEANPNNTDIVNYRIYLIEGEQKTPLATVGTDTFVYLHRRVEKDKSYAYWIVAVNSLSREGQPAAVVVQ